MEEKVNQFFLKFMLIKLDKKIEIISIAKKLEEIYSKRSKSFIPDKRSNIKNNSAYKEMNHMKLYFHRKKEKNTL